MTRDSLHQHTRPGLLALGLTALALTPHAAGAQSLSPGVMVTFNEDGSVDTLDVTQTGTYTFQIAGAAGASSTFQYGSTQTNSGGLGASLSGTITLAQGDYDVVVGQAGMNGTSGAQALAGGGGATFLYAVSGSTQNPIYTPILVAGAGGGACSAPAGQNAVVNGGNASLLNAQDDPNDPGQGGSGGSSVNGFNGGGGAGWSSNGGTDIHTPSGQGGKDRANGFGGGTGAGGLYGRGGFGGGGGGFDGGGGGGGYDGGNGGAGSGNTNPYEPLPGQGGTSYWNTTTSYDATVTTATTNGGDGFLTLSSNASAAPEPSQTAVLAFMAVGLGALMVRARKRQAA